LTVPAKLINIDKLKNKYLNILYFLFALYAISPKADEVIEEIITAKKHPLEINI
jgi:hypothetical protein